MMDWGGGEGLVVLLVLVLEVVVGAGQEGERLEGRQVERDLVVWHVRRISRMEYWSRMLWHGRYGSHGGR